MAKLFNFKSVLTATKPEQKIHSTAIVFIFIAITIDVIGFGLIIPVMPKLIAELKNVSIGQASLWGGYLLTVYAVMQFIFSPLVGNLSDKYGRRPIILIALLGFFCRLCIACIGTYLHAIGYWQNINRHYRSKFYCGYRLYGRCEYG